MLKIIQGFDTIINLQSDMTLAALFVGVFSGVGLGIIFKYGGTTGGIDIIARILNQKIDWTLGKTMFLFDFFVITLAIFTILTPIQGMYTIVAVYISAKVIDLIQKGAYKTNGVLIMSQDHKSITADIHQNLNRSVTLLNGTGGFSKDKLQVLY